jgi:uncharacterized protein (DUF1778 family)
VAYACGEVVIPANPPETGKSRYPGSAIERLVVMPVRPGIPKGKEKMIRKAATKAGKTKSAFILEAVDEKLGLVKDRERHIIRELAGWLPAEEAKKLRESLRVFREIHEGTGIETGPRHEHQNKNLHQ